MPVEDPASPPKQLRPISWWIAVCGIAAIVVSIWGVYEWLSAAAAEAPNPKAAQVQVDIIRNALTVGAGLGGVAALLLAFRRQQFVERQHKFYEGQQYHHEQTTKLDYEQRERAARHVEEDAAHRRITEMRIQAVEQLGSDKAPVRIGGLHNLERLGEDHPELRPLVLSEICAYLRMPYAPGEDDDGDIDAYSRVERQVRLTAQRVLLRHLRNGPSFWTHKALDLTGAVLINLDLNGCELHGANFESAHFSGTTSFDQAKFHGTVNFTDATADHEPNQWPPVSKPRRELPDRVEQSPSLQQRPADHVVAGPVGGRARGCRDIGQPHALAAGRAVEAVGQFGAARVVFVDQVRSVGTERV